MRPPASSTWDTTSPSGGVTCKIISTSFSTSFVFRHDITKRGIIASLVEPLKSPSTKVQSKISEAVAAYVTGADARLEVRNHLLTGWQYFTSFCSQMRSRGGLAPLVQLLQSSDNDVRKYSSWALLACSGDSPSALAISKLE